MNKTMQRKLAAGILAVSILLSQSVVPVAAQAFERPSGVSNTNSGQLTICENHKEHTDDCGYKEATEGSPCSHLNEDGSYSCAPVSDSDDESGNDTAPSDATYVCDHTDGCDYQEAMEGADCTHSCEVCKPDKDDEQSDLQEQCSCKSSCTATLTNPDCPVCSAENADLAECVGEVANTLELQPETTGAFTVTGGTLNDDYSYANSTLTVLTGTAITISNTDPATPTTDKIVTADNVAANITLNGVNINVSSGGTCAFIIQGNSSVNLIIDGKNILKSGGYQAGLRVEKGASVVIDGTGSLEATGGSKGAGIGGAGNIQGNGDNCGNITIVGGTVIASSKDSWGTYYAAGIGGGAGGIDAGRYIGGAGGKVRILGGTVIATGSVGIGGGKGNTIGGDGGSLFIENAYVVANGGIGGGTHKAAGRDGSDGEFSCQNSVVFADFIRHQEGLVASNGVIFEGDNGKVYGNITLDADMEIPKGKSLTIESGNTLTISKGVTLTNNGTINNNGTIQNDGIINSNGIIGGSGTISGIGEVTIPEQFDLPLGETYYFDLSSEAGNIGTINTAVPDQTLHYVPFTYAGTVNAYSLDASSSGNTGASAAATPSNRSLFVADYNVSNSISWDDLNAANLIFGKTFDRNYTLRSLSAGSSKIDSPLSGTPTTNEWDSVLVKNNAWIQNWKDSYTWGQDTDNSLSEARCMRGYYSAAYWYIISAESNPTTLGWRPALEVLNPAALTSDGLKAVTLNLNGGTFNNAGSINIICAGDTFTAPSGTGLTRPSGNIDTCFKWNTQADGKGTEYEVGGSVPSTVTTLYAQWEIPKEITPTAGFRAIDANSGNLYDVTSDMKYQIDNGPWVDINSETTLMNLSPCTIKLVKKGDGIATADSAEQIITITKSATPNLIATQPSVIGGTGSIPMSDVHEYNTDNGMSWTPASGVTNLAAGTYYVRVEPNGTVLASDSQTITINAFVPIPSYSISLSQNGVYTFAGAKVGYGQQTPLTVTVQNTGNQATGALTAALIGTNADGFSLSKKSISDIAIGDSDSFTVSPNTGLSAGTYIATITVSGGNNIKADFNVSFTVSPTPIVTFNPNGGIVTPANGVTNADGKLASLPIPTKSGSRFDGWFLTADGGTEVTTATVFTQDSTIYAHWIYTGGGGSSSGGNGSSGGGNTSVTSSAADKPNAPTKSEIKVDGKVDGNGNANVTVSDKVVNDAIQNAEDTAKKDGTTQNGISISINVNPGNKNVNRVSTHLSENALKSLIDKKVVSVTFSNPDLKVSLDLAALKEVYKQAQTGITFTASKVDSNKLTGTRKTAIGTRPAFGLAITNDNNKQVSNFGTGTVSIEIPYGLSSNEKAGDIYAVYVDSKGEVQWLTNSVYDSVKKVLRFSTNHFSFYGVGYKADNTNFTDIDNHWAKDSINFVVSRGLLTGTSKTAFSPNTAMTRGMFVTVLYRLAGSPSLEDEILGYPFADVDATAYYGDAVYWARLNKIANGVTEENFVPNNAISREQMAVIMTNYAKAIDFNLPKVHAENTFADSANISSWAKEAVKQMQMAGVIGGKDGNKFDPQGTATRAEVSAVLKRFVELVINSDTAQD